MFEFKMNLQLFADAGTLVNATTQYVNAYDGSTTAFDSANTLSPGMKTFYALELLENGRPELRFAQLGRKENLPANKGKMKEWRKWNKLPNATQLTEGVIPAGQKMGQTTLTAEIAQFGMYVTVSDVLELRHIDDVIMGATEELGASASLTLDTLIRNELQTGTNVFYCDNVASDGSVTTPTGYASMVEDQNRLTPEMINKAATYLRKSMAPTINGKYVAVVHPSVTFDLRQSDEWIESHKYAATTEIFNGEIGELHGVRFVESTNAKITEQTLSDGKGLVYSTLIFGKDAFGIIDPEGGALEMIIKNRSEIGGPLEQFSTCGYKFSHACKLLYPDRMVRLESCSSMADTDQAN